MIKLYNILSTVCIVFTNSYQNIPGQDLDLLTQIVVVRIIKEELSKKGYQPQSYYNNIEGEGNLKIFLFVKPLQAT